MRFLCLPGAFGNAKNFEVQLAPFCKEFASSNSTTFFFTQGEYKYTPPPGFLDYFGPPPHYRFIESDSTRQNDMLERVRDFPEGENAEDVMRKLVSQGQEEIHKSADKALDALYRTMDEHGPFDSIAAYSEGAMMAGTLILDEQRRFQEEGRERHIKFAVFFAGWPPLNPESNELVLSDTSEELIDIPTCHVVGANDPYLHGAMGLFNVCDQNSAILFDHGKGHTIPRNAQTLKELGDVVRGIAAESTQVVGLDTK
ncbi:MAG: hypothetical protein MMC33_008509 [Icmadophila ericetorum]|nr:hypothetical protein [Icmadophila ericetorum]